MRNSKVTSWRELDSPMSTAKPSWTSPAVVLFHSAGNWEWGPPGRAIKWKKSAHTLLRVSADRQRVFSDRGWRPPEGAGLRWRSWMVSPGWHRSPNQLKRRKQWEGTNLQNVFFFFFSRLCVFTIVWVVLFRWRWNIQDCPFKLEGPNRLMKGLPGHSLTCWREESHPLSDVHTNKHRKNSCDIMGFSLEDHVRLVWCDN